MKKGSSAVAPFDIKAFDGSAIQAFMPAEKIGVVATVNPAGVPHLTLITSIRASHPAQLTLGEFCKGCSKHHIQRNPNVAFLILTMDRRMWRGHARWTHLKTEGPEYESYNDLPMFRYNAYFGINTVHYLDLVDATGPERLPLPSILLSSLLTGTAKGAVRTGTADRILTPFAQKLFNRFGALKFLAWIKDDGFPEIVPILQCRAADSRRLVFSPLAYGRELSRVPTGATVAVFGLTMKMEDVLVRGRYAGATRRRMIRVGTVDIEWVYNSMPPAHGQIYPPVPLAPVTGWDDFDSMEGIGEGIR
jgi:hypothetical protein